MRKLLIAALSALGVGLIAVTPEQTQAQMVTWTFSGQQSGSSVRTETISRTINEVQQPTITRTSRTSYSNVYPSTTYSAPIGSSWNQPIIPQFNLNPPIVPQFSNISNFGSSQWNKNYQGW